MDPTSVPDPAARPVDRQTAEDEIYRALLRADLERRIAARQASQDGAAQ